MELGLDRIVAEMLSKDIVVFDTGLVWKDGGTSKINAHANVMVLDVKRRRLFQIDLQGGSILRNVAWFNGFNRMIAGLKMNRVIQANWRSLTKRMLVCFNILL